MSESRKSDRLHGFDAVRGLAAVAVVALHAAYPYALTPLAGLVWPVPLDEPSRIADTCFWAIEGFVMPLFFTISGYFLAQSLARQSPGRVVVGRSRRLVVSFWTVGIVVLAVDLLTWTAGFAATGQATWNDFRRMKFGPAIDDHLWGPGHLWYLEYLWVLCVGACLATWCWNLAIRQLGPLILFFPRWFQAVAAVESPRFLPCLAGLSIVAFVVLGSHPEIVLGFQHHFIVPAWPKLAHGGLFLLLGIVLHQAAGAIDFVRRIAPMMLAATTATFVLLLFRIHNAMVREPESGFATTLGFLLATYAISAVLGFLGGGLRWLDRPIPGLQRLAAASFWIYVAHHPICGLLHLTVRPLGIPPAAKFGLVAAATLGVCLYTYGLFVESGAVGRMLDGEWPWRAFRQVTPQPVPTTTFSEVRKAA